MKFRYGLFIPNHLHGFLSLKARNLIAIERPCQTSRSTKGKQSNRFRSIPCHGNWIGGWWVMVCIGVQIDKDCYFLPWRAGIYTNAAESNSWLSGNWAIERTWALNLSFHLVFDATCQFPIPSSTFSLVRLYWDLLRIGSTSYWLSPEWLPFPSVWPEILALSALHVFLHPAP